MPTDAAGDACVVINLVATGRSNEILAASDHRLLVPRIVADHELGYLDIAGSDPLERELIDLAPLVGAGSALVVDLVAEELDEFVIFARDVDDGEAAALAIARHRELRIATDDRKAQRVASQAQPSIAIIRTSELLRTWSENVPPAEVSAALRAIRDRAHYLPRSSDPNYAWWEELLGD